MNNNIEKDLKKYYNDISKSLTCNRKKKQNIINTIKRNIKSYRENNPNANIDEIINHFGNPSDIAEAYYDTETAEDISSKIKLSHKILICTVTALVLALLVYIVMVITVLMHSIKSESAYGETIITETSQSDII